MLWKLVTSAEIASIIWSSDVFSEVRASTVSFNCSLFLAIMQIFAPFFRSWSAIALPKPELPPVITQNYKNSDHLHRIELLCSENYIF